MRDVPCLYQHIEQTVNLGNYQSAKVCIGISGLPFDATEEEIERAMETHQIVFSKLKVGLREKIAKVRMEGVAPKEEAA